MNQEVYLLGKMINIKDRAVKEAKRI